MLNTIHINNVKITSREKRKFNNATGWIYILEDGTELISKEIDKCVITCVECGTHSTPISLRAKFFKTEWLCKSCCKTGERNPFYGKTHDREMIEVTKIQLRKISQELWKNDEYRNDIIAKVSKPRREGFKAEQSARVTQWYKDNPEQKTLRSKSMKKSWDDGAIIPNENIIKYNRSKGELELFNIIEESFPKHQVNVDSIRIGNKWIYPDICIDNSIIIEYYGNFWHGNPEMYCENDIVAKDTPAKEIWNKDKKRVDLLVEAGYSVLIIWEKDYLKNKEETCLKLKENIQVLLSQ